MRKKYAPGLIVTLHMILLSEMGSNCDRSGHIFMMILQTLFQCMIIMSIISKGVLAADTSCVNQHDCPVHQFCYDLSKICVNYTNCSLYNRKEGPTGAQIPSQCGGCIEGYIAEVQTTGDEESACKKNAEFHENLPAKPNIDKIWICVALVILSLVIIGLVSYYLKKRFSRGEKKWFKPTGTWRFTPSAPSPENGLYHLQRSMYSDEEPPIYASIINNNNNTNDNNSSNNKHNKSNTNSNNSLNNTDKTNNIKSNIQDRLVNATPSNPPSWVNIDNNYDEDNGIGNTSASTAISTTLEIEDEETNPSSWTPENVTVQVPIQAFHQFATEQRDNVLNAVLVRGDCSSNATAADENIAGSPPLPPPPPEATGGSRRTGAGGNTYRGPNVQINQMITLNVLKTDD